MTSIVPIPAGVIDHDDWPSVTAAGVPVRSLLWLDLPSVQVCGSQYADDGRVEREIAVTGEYEGLTASAARELAAQLIIAADKLDELEGSDLKSHPLSSSAAEHEHRCTHCGDYQTVPCGPAAGAL